MPTTDLAEINLGAEHDTSLQLRLKNAISMLGGSIRETSYSVVGSQEIIEFSITLPAGTLRLVSETYVGITLCGSKTAVNGLVEVLSGA